MKQKMTNIYPGLLRCFQFLICIVSSMAVAYFIKSQINSVDGFSPPYALVAIFVLPLAYALQAKNALEKLHLDIIGLSRAETERLHFMVQSKAQRLQYLTIFYLLSAAFVGLSFFLMAADFKVWGKTFILVGLVFGLVMYSFFYIHNIQSDIYDFTLKVKERQKKRNDIKSLRKKLASSDTTSPKHHREVSHC